MRILLIHNAYGKPSGEEAVVAQQAALLREHGHDVAPFFRGSAEIDAMPFGEIRAFFGGIYNPFSRRRFRRFLAAQSVDLAHVHNVFPLISPAVLPECRRQRLPVVMTLHNYRLLCPNALLLRNGRTCRLCLGGHEEQCILRRCESSGFRGVGYALRTAVARRFRLFLDNVDLFICLSAFQRSIFIEQGFPADRCVVIPNAPPPDTPHVSAVRTPASRGEFVVYVGRISPEKDVETLLAAAQQCPDIPFRIAGSYWRMPDLPGRAAPNIRFLGELGREAVHSLYASARLIVLATRCYEGFPTVLLEAMAHARPVVCSNIGGLPEIVDDGRTGLLYTPGDAHDLAEKARRIYDDPAAADAMGSAGHSKACREFSRERVYADLARAYEQALALSRSRPSRRGPG